MRGQLAPPPPFPLPIPNPNTIIPTQKSTPLTTKPQVEVYLALLSECQRLVAQELLTEEHALVAPTKERVAKAAAKLGTVSQRSALGPLLFSSFLCVCLEFNKTSICVLLLLARSVSPGTAAVCLVCPPD